MIKLCCICYNVDMKYNVIKDIQAVKTLLNLSNTELANYLNVARSTINRIVNGKVQPTSLFLESFYSFAYHNPIRNLRLNNLKVQFVLDKYDTILFHGAKNNIVGSVDLSHSRKEIDVGVGFYLGETYTQAVSYIFLNRDSSVYLFDTKELSSLKTKEFNVSFEWMIMVCYYRNQIDRFKENKIVKDIIKEVEEADVIIAPIADNNMFEIMNQFARGDITELQAMSALSASNLGKQHVLKSIRACNSIKMIDRLYICKEEREDIGKEQQVLTNIAYDKSKLAIEQFRHQGKYIEEILK